MTEPEPMVCLVVPALFEVDMWTVPTESPDAALLTVTEAGNGSRLAVVSVGELRMACWVREVADPLAEANARVVAISAELGAAFAVQGTVVFGPMTAEGVAQIQAIVEAME